MLLCGVTMRQFHAPPLGYASEYMLQRMVCVVLTFIERNGLHQSFVSCECISMQIDIAAQVTCV